MKRARRMGIRGGMLMLLGSCAAVPPPALRASEPMPVNTPRPIAATAAQPAVATTNAAPMRADFTIDGTMVQGGMAIGHVPTGTSMLTFDGQSIPVAADGSFLIAFDRDAGPSATLVATLNNGRQVTRTLAIAPRAWNISRLDRLPIYPVPSAEFKRLRPPELAQIHEARAKVTDAQGWRQQFMWPVTGRISTHFGAQRIYKGGEKGSYHSGTDIAVPVGTPVLAPADGVVILATSKPFTLEGNLLMVDHGMGLNSAFLHLSKIMVHVGQKVRKGQVIALTGKTGRATGPHLHWGLKWRAARIDPELVAGPMPVAD